MKINQWLIGVAVTFMVAGCAVTDKVTSVFSGDDVSDVYSAGVAGTYYAKLPCQSCGNLVVDLLLEKNQTYSMIKYPQNSENEYYEVGIWQQQGNKIALQPKRGKQQSAIGVPVKNFVITAENQLQLLDAKGKRYPKATHYVFKKK